MIRLASPDIREEDIRRVTEVLRSGNLVQGENVSCLETELQKFSGIGNCAVVSSGTAALHLALKVLGVTHGDSVITPAFTFPATANAVINSGADVILCDVAKDTYVVTPELLQKTITKNLQANLKAVIVVHEFGYPADIKSLREICNKNNLKLIEDSACALGTIADDHHTGYYSDVACFSFHPRKAITSGEGGAVLSNNKDIVQKIKCLRNHGMHNNEQGADVIAAGLNYRMTDFQAALTVEQLLRFPEELSKRKKLATIYQELLCDSNGLHLPQNSQGHSWQSYMVTLDKQIDRNSIIRSLLNRGIETNLGAQALHQMTFYKNKYCYGADEFKTAAALYKNGLVLPLYGKLQPDEITFISQTLKEVLNES